MTDTKSKSTPGPWKYDGYNVVFGDGGKEICAIPDHPHDGTYTPEQIAERSAWYRESEDNAFLIASAPDLAAEIQRLQAIERRYLAMVEHGWHLKRLSDDVWGIYRTFDSRAWVKGPTPDAALDAAIELEGK